MSRSEGASSQVIFVRPGDGRSYQAGAVRAVFKADGARAGALNLFMPGGFEVMMPAIIDYFAKQSDSEDSEE